ncbi:hypothetical protein L195_g007522 [Trifolium pratense]|uniref:Uncharacterized protein n=2 Tax=Trifolium TaxID=3898 RepID=A0A2K3P6M1_TRIPR|nr:hypothetical protein L195_g007522 [Trifolium pratense]
MVQDGKFRRREESAISNQQSAMADIVEEDESEKVEIILKTIGPAPTSRLRVPSFIKISSFFRKENLVPSHEMEFPTINSRSPNEISAKNVCFFAHRGRNGSSLHDIGKNIREGRLSKDNYRRVWKYSDEEVERQAQDIAQDCLIVAVKPKPPVKDGHDNDDDDEDLKFQLPHSSSRWKKRLYSFLHDKLKLPGAGVIYRPALLARTCSTGP